MRIETGNSSEIPLPYPEVDEDDEDGDENSGGTDDGSEPALVAANVQSQKELQAQKEAQQSVLDLTRNIQRKKDRELAQLQTLGGNVDGGTQRQQTVSKTAKVGRNELCPCGSGKKYKRCCGALA